MASAAIETMVKLMENLPEATQMQMVDHMREYLLDLVDEAQWDETFARTQEALGNAADEARAESASGAAKPMSFDSL